MNILLISTLAINPGDEIIRLGAEHVLRQVFPDANFRTIHKHDPRTLFSGFKQKARTPPRLISPLLYRLYATFRGRRELNYLENADIIVFAGSPFIWRSDVRLFRFTSANAEWVPSIWRRLFQDLRDKPVLNLAAGAFANQSQMDAIVADPKVSGFLKQAVGHSILTTARDVETQEVLARLGFQIDLIPCTSILSAQGAFLSGQKPEYVAINVMRAAGHNPRGHHNLGTKWEATIRVAVSDIEKRHSILFVSHSQDEDATVAEWFPHHRRLFSKDPIELLKAYSKARYGLCNRVHSGAAVASFARPVIVVGGDSRIDLISQFGMPAVDHREIDGPGLVTMVQHVEQNYDKYVDTLRGVIRSTERRYIEAIAATQIASINPASVPAMGRQ